MWLFTKLTNGTNVLVTFVESPTLKVNDNLEIVP